MAHLPYSSFSSPSSLLTPLLKRAARVAITPQPCTLAESTAVLRHLQTTFGPVTAFLNPRYVPALKAPTDEQPNRFLVVFASPTSLQAARAAGSFAITVWHDQPN